MSALDLDSLWRLLVAFGCGACLGLNRDLHHKPAGVRTFSLVSVGAAVATMAAAQMTGGDNGTVGRVMQGILTGIGFVGAGVIFHGPRGRNVAGLTTAAAIWFAAALGIASGLGRFALVVMGLVAALVVLVLGGPIEEFAERLIKSKPRPPGEGGGPAP